MWLDMMIESCFQHLLSVSFDFMPGDWEHRALRSMDCFVPPFLVAVHQFSIWFSEFYALTEHVGTVRQDDCPICFSSLAGRPVKRLPCGHSVCTKCVVEIRAKGVSKTCPLCRAPLPPPGLVYLSAAVGVG